MPRPSLVYLSTDEARRKRHADALREAGFEVVTGSPAAGAPMVEKVKPAGVVIDFAGADPQLASDLAAWLRGTRPHRDHPTFALNVPVEARDSLAGRAPGLRIVEDDRPGMDEVGDDRFFEAVKEAFVGQMGFMVKHKGRGVAYDGDVMIV